MNSIFNTNIKLLNKYDEDLAYKISNYSVCDALKIIPTKCDKFPNLIRTEHNKTKKYYSSINPDGHVARKCDKFLAENDNLNGVIIFGFALGYHAIQFLKLDLDILFIVETDISILYLAFSNIDLSKILLKKIKFLYQDDLSLLRDLIIQDARKFFSLKFNFFYSDCYEHLFSFYKKVEKITLETNMEICESVNFLENYAFVGERQIAENFALYIKSAGIIDLKNKFTHIPAMVVASGPSLTENLKYIKEYQEKFLIICVDTSYRLLLENNIKPHFVVTNDIGEENFHRHLQNVLGDAHYISDLSIYPESFKNFGNKIFFSDSTNFSFAKWIIKNFDINKGSIEGGTNSGAFAISIAIYLGCDVIVFNGFDLIGADSHKHVKGVFDSPVLNDNQFEIRDVAGNKKNTSRLWFLFKQNIEKIIKLNSKCSFYQTSCKGANFEGAENISLYDLLKQNSFNKYELFNKFSDYSVDLNKIDQIVEKLTVLKNSLILLCEFHDKSDISCFFQEFNALLAKNEQLEGLIDIFLKNEIIHIQSFLEQNKQSSNFDFEQLHKNLNLIFNKLKFVKSLIDTMLKKINKV